MSSKDVLKKAKELGWSGSDIFIPTTKYPHVHVHKDFCVFSTSSSSHKDLARGSKLYKSNAQSVLDDIRDTDAKAVIQYVIDNA
jgi:hypothetical protein